MSEPLVLASGSAIRRQILQQACIEFDVIKSAVDEDAIKQANPDLPPRDMALLLAKAKAGAVASQTPGRLVLGADQTMELDEGLLDKLPRPELARERLMAMRGREHFLHSGLALYRDDKLVWSHQQTSTLHVREFSDDFLDFYLSTAGDELTASVGAYAYEGLGAQLFERVDADYFGVLGLPLMPLLAALRDQGLAPA